VTSWRAPAALRRLLPLLRSSVCPNPNTVTPPEAGANSRCDP
jgi:hypothetical protein